MRIAAAILLAVALLMPASAYAAEAAFQQRLQNVWPEAQALGVSRATFDAAFETFILNVSGGSYVNR